MTEQTKSIETTVSDMLEKAADVLSQAAMEHGPKAIDLTLEVARIAAIREAVLPTVLVIVGVFGLVVFFRKFSAHWKETKENHNYPDLFDCEAVVVLPCFFGSVISLLLVLVNFKSIFAIHAWVGMFHPEVYLLYRAIF